MAISSETPTAAAIPAVTGQAQGVTGEGERHHLLLTLSPEMYERIERLAQRAGTSKADVLNIAIGLYKTITDAVDEGKRVGTLDDPDVELDTEFVDL